MSSNIGSGAQIQRAAYKFVKDRESCFELKFSDDITRFIELLPRVGFVCGSSLLDPEINASCFYDIEPD